MKPCKEFSEWLSRLPREDISPIFNEHIDQCPLCKELYLKHLPVIQKLNRAAGTPEITEETLLRLTEKAKSESLRLQNRKLAWQLSGLSVLCLPLVIVINVFWGAAGYYLLTSYTTQLIADIYIGLYGISVICLSSLSFSFVPLLAGWLRGKNMEEISS